MTFNFFKKTNKKNEQFIDMLRETSLDYICSFLGKWYKWGGDDPSGFDCSGLAVEYCKSFGAIPRKSDFTAFSLWEKLKFSGCEVEQPYEGCLVFWENTKHRIVHVEIMLNEEQSIGASGGGSKTLTEKDAIVQNAFIKVRPIYSVKGRKITGFQDPFLAFE